MIVFFLNILFFQLLRKSDVEREIIAENFEKNEMRKRNSRRKFWKKKERKKVRETMKKNLKRKFLER
jgi:hypothetical protein